MQIIQEINEHIRKCGGNNSSWYAGLNKGGFCWIKTDQLSDKYLVHKNDILFLTRGYRNFPVPIMDSTERTIAASHFFIFLRRKAR